ncbi:MAG: hypothetical protein CVT98_02590, partial [Bacteroidetes bacterium HGW-Bacteroidetes-15]
SQKEVVFAICQDISVRIEAERIVRLSEEKFSKAFDTNAVMMTISTLDEGRFLDVNETFLNITGLTREQAVGKTSSELNIFPDIGLRNQLKELILIEGRARDLETIITNTKGQKLICNFSMELIDIQGEPCLLAVLSDITERKQAEEKILLSEQRFRQLAELLPEKVFEADAKGRITFVNNYLLSFFGFDANRFEEGIHISSLFHKKSQKNIKDYLKGSKSSFELPSVELVAQKSDGSQVPVLTHITAVIENGKVNRYMGIMVDISARKQQEIELVRAKEQAEEASKAKEQFLSTMSHEIRTPMNAIMGFSGLLTTSQLTPEKQKHFAQIIKKRSADLLKIIDDILDISKIEANQLKIHKERGSVNKLLDDLLDYSLTRVELENKPNLRVSLVNQVINESDILADFGRLKQVLFNLIENAIKFTKEGVIEIGCKKTDEKTLQFYVKDSGQGIAKEKHSLIFERFSQAHDSERADFGGTGLGLAISKGLIELMDGNIWVESELGKGATFFFNISNISIPNKHEQKKEIQEATTTIIINDTILIVEDDELNATFIQEILKQTSAPTLTAYCGKEALELIRNRPEIKIILLDLRLPDFNGLDLIQELKAISPSLKIIIQSAYATNEDIIIGEKAGCDGYVTKPIDEKKLIKLISQLSQSNN